MSSCATVSPPMPESKTPIGAELPFTVLALPHDARGNLDAAACSAHVHVGVEVGEVCSDPCIRAGKEMIEYDRRDPVFEVSTSGAPAVGEILVLGLSDCLRQSGGRIEHRLAAAIEDGDDRRVTPRGSGEIEIVFRLDGHSYGTDLGSDKEPPHLPAIEIELAQPRNEERADESGAR